MCRQSKYDLIPASSTGLVSTKDMAKVGIIIGVIGFVLAFFWLTKIFPFPVR